MKKKFKLEKDFLDFLEICNQKALKYLVIGGYAVSIHGYPRYTKDLDVCIELSEANADKMIAVINEFGFRSLRLTKEDFLKKFYHSNRQRTCTNWYFERHGIGSL